MIKFTAFAALLLATSAQASTLIVPANSIIFAAGLASLPALPGGGGSLPPSIDVVAGQRITIHAAGDVTPAVGSGLDTHADGFDTNPVAGSATVLNSTGSAVGNYTGTRSFGLLGTFTGGAVSSAVFNVGSSFTIVVPTDATRLFFGFADGYALTGPASYYNDNGGFVTLTASVPEPGTWALMITGFGLVGAAARRRAVATVA